MNTFNLECGVETVPLHVDAEAAVAISNKFGGLFNAFNAIKSINLEQITEIVRIGSKRPVTQEQIFGAGLSNLAGPVTEYLNRLLTGGKE